MDMREIELPQEVPGALWLSGMPARDGPWSDFLAQARERQLNRVVCLTNLVEVQSVSPSYRRAVRDEAARQALPFHWQMVPLADLAWAESEDSFRLAIDEVVQGLTRGERVLMHCAGGVGRAGSAAACVLKAMGLSADDALERVREAGSNPQSTLQAIWIEHF